MPRLHFVKSARKARPEHGIEVGDSYYWWAFRVGGWGSIKRYSKTRPARSQLTQSAFLSQLYDIEDGIDERLRGYEGDDGTIDRDGLDDELSSLCSDIEALGDEAQESFDNMPESLQQGPTGELLEQRTEAMQEWASDIQSIDVQDEDKDLDAIIDEVHSGNPGVE